MGRRVNPAGPVSAALIVELPFVLVAVRPTLTGTKSQDCNVDVVVAGEHDLQIMLSGSCACVDQGVADDVHL